VDAAEQTTPGVDLTLLDEIATGLAEVQSALDRIDAGTYGRCEHCGAPILDATLESHPTARHCAAHLPFGGDTAVNSGQSSTEIHQA
jgi:RNA polymerase-binding transcription factor DksA